MDDRRRPVILVLEDEADLAATCARLLRRRGHAVIVAGSRAAALRALADATPSALVCDVLLPDGDGLDVVRAAASMRQPVPAMVITARASETGRVAATAAGAMAYLPKPFTADSFVSHVDRILVDRA
ncbi:MAG TPA: response regulator [Methylomirabilota bacterium]|nr:response regulator [Methylomirabilota bacterium]